MKTAIKSVKMESAPERTTKRKMLEMKVKDKILCREIGTRARVKDVVKFSEGQNWKWAGRIARMSDNRWAKRTTEWQPRSNKRLRG